MLFVNQFLQSLPRIWRSSFCRYTKYKNKNKFYYLRLQVLKEASIKMSPGI
jgi:hypothetical protein